MALTLSGTNGVVGAGFTLDPSGVSVTAGVGTFTSLQGSAASLTQIPAANLVGVCTSGLTRTGGFGGGKVLQVQQTVKDDTTSASATDTWEDISGMSVSITPSDSSNKIRVTGVINACTSNGQYWVLRVVKDGSTFGAEGTSPGSRAAGFGGKYDLGSSYEILPTVFDFLDTAGGTSSITYKIQWYNPYGSATRYLNRTADDANADYRFRTASTITATEISA